MRQFAKVTADQLMRSVADSSKAYISVLNSHRQVIFANTSFVDTFGVEPDAALGIRPGDMFSCETRTEGTDGCGTSSACADCGAAQVLRSARLGAPREDECRIVQDGGEALDLRVTATPFELEGEEYFLFTAIDISNAKRRESLERIFFHDIMNTATGVRGLSTMARAGVGEGREEALAMLEQISEHLIDEIQAQRDLLAAESGDLNVRVEQINSGTLLAETIALYESHDVGVGKHIVVPPDSEGVVFQSDPTLLGRVLGNLLKNALEATPAAGEVSVSCRATGPGVAFYIRNPSVMPPEVQHQVFHRSFSTKGPGRGLGTYGARLLTERYLHGNIAFESNKEDGTQFRVAVPTSPSTHHV